MKERKTALVLSGGGSRGAYQCGVWQALEELGKKIDIVVGVSVGAINGAMVVQGDVVKTANLWRKMETDMIFDVEEDADAGDFAKEFLRNGGAGTRGLQSLMDEYLDEDLIRETDQDFGILTVEFPSMKPHYLWLDDIPQGKLKDYIIASSSAFPAVHTHEIDGVEYIDGGYEDNLPVTMAVDKGATEIIAVYLDAVGKFYPEELKDIPNLTFIKSKWDLGDFLVFENENSKRNLRIGYLDAMKTFDVYDGDYYTFVKGEFDKRTLPRADCAAKVFEINPLILYKKESLIEALSDPVSDILDKMEKSRDIGNLTKMLYNAKAKDFLKIASSKTLAVFIARSLREKGRNSIFESKYTRKILREEIYAAEFLLKYGLV